MSPPSRPAGWRLFYHQREPIEVTSDGAPGHQPAPSSGRSDRYAGGRRPAAAPAQKPAEPSVRIRLIPPGGSCMAARGATLCHAYPSPSRRDCADRCGICRRGAAGAGSYAGAARVAVPSPPGGRPGASIRRIPANPVNPAAICGPMLSILRARSRRRPRERGTGTRHRRSGGQRMASHVIHVEVVGKDGPALQTFYGRCSAGSSTRRTPWVRDVRRRRRGRRRRDSGRRRTAARATSRSTSTRTTPRPRSGAWRSSAGV